MGKKESLVRQLRAFAREIAPDYLLQKMILFGSQATGKPHKDSDVDLIIVSTKFSGVPRVERSPDLYLRWELDYPVDFLCYTPEEFKRKKKQIGIVQKAVEEGVEVYAS